MMNALGEREVHSFPGNIYKTVKVFFSSHTGGSLVVQIVDYPPR